MHTRVVIIDEHEVSRVGLRVVLRGSTRYLVVGEAGARHEALELVRATAPDVVLVDLDLGGDLGGPCLVEALRRAHAGLRILCLSRHDGEANGHYALQAGAHGFVSKIAPLTRLVDALDRVASGAIYASEEVLAHHDRMAPTPLALAPREREVLALIGHGHGTRQIASQLGISIKTVETHRANIKAKLGLDTAPQLARFAVAWRLRDQAVGGG